MQDEPELLVPISELHRQRAEFEARAAAPADLSGAKLLLWRLWVLLGAVTILPITVGAFIARRTDEGLWWGCAVVFVLWLAIAYLTGPLSLREQKR